MMAIDMFFRLYTPRIPRSRSGYYCGILDDTLYFEEGLEERCDKQKVWLEVKIRFAYVP